MKATIAVVVNVVAITAAVTYAGGSLPIAAAAAAAVTIGGGGGLVIGRWLEANGYTMQEVG